MKRATLEAMTVQELVQEFAAVAVQQDTALLENDNAKVTRLFWRLEAIENELKIRDGDQRCALLSLYSHPNMQVRLKAVKATLAVAPERARRALKSIADSRVFPQAGEAGMSLLNLERGIYKPT